MTGEGLNAEEAERPDRRDVDGAGQGRAKRHEAPELPS